MTTKKITKRGTTGRAGLDGKRGSGESKAIRVRLAPLDFAALADCVAREGYANPSAAVRALIRASRRLPECTADTCEASPLCAEACACPTSRRPAGVRSPVSSTPAERTINDH